MRFLGQDNNKTHIFFPLRHEKYFLQIETYQTYK